MGFSTLPFLLFSICARIQYSVAFIDSKGFGIKVRLSPDSPLSPAYNRPNASTDERIETLYQRAIAVQNKYINRMGNVVSPDGGLPIFHSQDSGLEYETTIGVGDPIVDVTLIVDTGSGLTWWQCVPCPNCYKQTRPMYNPALSRTYSSVPCTHIYCTSSVVRGMNCDTLTSNCQYSTSYGDGSTTAGVISKEKVVLPNSDGGVDNIDQIIFGCGHSNRGLFKPQQNGILGLDMRPISILQQKREFTHSRFSYCNAPYFAEGGSSMLFGDQAILKGYSIPLDVTDEDNYYFIELIGIIVNNELLRIPPGEFARKKDGRGGMFMDIGSPMTMLIPAAYDLLARKLMDTVKLQWVSDARLLCFKGTTDDLKNPTVPDIKFQFNRLRIGWKPEFSFMQVGEKVCLSVLKSPFPISVLGSLFTQNFNIGIDIAAKKVFWKGTMCDEQ